MNQITAFLAIVGAISLGAISPGPSFVYIAQLAAQRRAAALQATIGMVIGGAFYGFLAVWGVAKVITFSPLAMNLLRVAGGVFLLYLCFSLWQASNSAFKASNNSVIETRPFIRGLVTQVSNPKTMIIYVSVYGALLPQQPASWLYLALPIAMFAIEAIWYSFVSLALSTSGSQNLYLKGKKWFDRAAGAVLGLIGLSFIAGIWVK